METKAAGIDAEKRLSPGKGVLPLPRLLRCCIVPILLLLGLAACKPPDYPIHRIVLDVTYTGAGNWSIILEPGAAPVLESGNRTYVFEESEGPFSFSVAKEEDTADTLTATLSLRTVWIVWTDRKTSSESGSTDEVLVVETTTDSYGTVSLGY